MVNRPSAGSAATLILLLTACAIQTPPPPPLPNPSNTPSPQPAASPVLTATASLVPSPSSTPAPSCLSEGGAVVQSEVVSPDLPRSLPYRVYLPPCAAERRGSLPVVILLHGLARTDSQWDELEMDELAEEWITSARAKPFLIVMPWERLGLDYEVAIAEHLIPHLEQTYGASPDRSLRAIGGISRGGGWALRIGLKHPELFGAIGLHSPAVLVSDLFDIPTWIESIPPVELPAIWIDMGERDTLRFALMDLTDLLDELGVPYTRQSFPGEHTAAYWSAHLEDYLRWYLVSWEDTGQAP